MKRNAWQILGSLALVATLAACGGSSGGGSGGGSSGSGGSGGNGAPVAVNDTGSTAKNTPVDVIVLANDSDPDGDPLSITMVTNPSNGSVTVISANTINYAPNTGFSGVDSFSYTIEDGQGGSDTATVTVSVTNTPPVADTDPAFTTAGVPVSVNVLANDSDADGDALSVTGFTTPANGAVTNLGGGVLQYTPNTGFTGADSFNYTVSDGTDTDTSTVMVTVAAGNNPPVANNDTASTTSPAAVDIDVLANDSDPDADPISITNFTTPANGTVSNLGGGVLRYTPNNGFTGTDSFSYTISDGALSDSATVTITVTAGNNPPVANDDTASTTSGTSVQINVLANDTDPDADPISITGFTQGSGGNVVDLGGGVLEYTPGQSFTGTDTFDYTISDGALTDTGTVTITVTAGNNAPVAANDTATTPGGTPVQINVLANDTDPDNDPLSITGFTTPANGTVTNVGNGVLQYAPNTGFKGTDTFDYTISDGSLTDTATVTVTVTNNAPVANDDMASTAPGTAVQVTVTANDVDADGDPLSVTGFTTPANGTVTNLGGGVLEYTPTNGFTGNDSFDYTLSDGTDTDTATVTITVSGAPVANDDTVNVNQNTATMIDVLANDTGGSLTVVSFGTAQHGTMMIVQNQIQYTPNNNYTGADSFTYTISNGTGNDTATVNITVVPVWTVASKAMHGLSTHKAYDIALTDLTGNGSVDVVASLDAHSGTPQLSAFENTSTTGSISFGTPATQTYTAQNKQMAIGDFNNDGNDDVVLSDGLGFSGSVSVYLQDVNTPGSFLAPQTFGISLIGNTWGLAIAAADFDGDGLDDIVATVSNFSPGANDEVNVLRNTTSTGATTCTFTLVGVDLFTSSQAMADITCGDLTGDGLPEITFTRYSTTAASTVGIYVNTSTSGSVSFNTVQDLATSGRASGIALGDLNGDGVLDIAVRHDSTVAVWLNTTTTPGGTVSVASPQSFSASGGVTGGVAIGDLNGDGKNDLVATGSTNDRVYVLLSRTPAQGATLTFNTMMSISVTGMDSPQQVRIADIDNDGVMDVVASSGGTGSTGSFAVIRGQTP